MKLYTATLLAITGIALPLAAWTTVAPSLDWANAAPQAIAQRGPGGPGGHGSGMDQMDHMDPMPPMLELADELGLSDAQRQEIQAIHTQAKTDAEDLRTRMEAIHTQMQTLMTSDASDAELRQQHDQMQALHHEMGDRRFETMLAIRNILTPEQRVKMQELRGNMGRHGGGPHSPEPGMQRRPGSGPRSN